MKRSLLAIAAAFSVMFFIPFGAGAQENDAVVSKIIETGKTDNQVMVHEDMLANRIGGRIVGSDALLRAEQWVKKQLEKWGYEVTVQQVGTMPVGFNRGPWSGRMLSEDGMVLHFGTPSYTAGTKGPQKGHVVIEPRSREEFQRMKNTIAGAWVLIGGKSNGFALDGSAKANAKRAEILQKNDSIRKVNREINIWNAKNPKKKKDFLKEDKTPALLYKEMVEAGALGFIQSAKVPITVLYNRANCNDFTIDSLPTVCDIKLDSKQYDIIYEKASRREDFLLEFDIRNHFIEGPVPFSNVIAVMKGSEYPDEYVISGGHLDSYDASCGAIDDGQGVSVNLESARLLAIAGAKPKRSIMFAIWTAEEFGLLGSKYFVQNNTVDLDKISNYFNRDGGPQVASSVTVIPAMYDDFVAAAEGVNEINPDFPFEVIKNEAPARPRPKSAGGSDHAYFAKNGVPTVSINLSDVKGYNFSYGEIWHSERDNYNKCIPEYMEHSAIVNAILIYRLANLDHILNRTGLYSDK